MSINSAIFKMLSLMLASQCFVNNFDVNDISQTQAGINVYLTQQGVTKYCEQNAKVAIDKVQATLLLPEINFQLSSFQITLNNGRFPLLQVSQIQFDFMDQQAYLGIYDISLQLVFELQIFQKSFPYLQDQGSLAITVEQLKFRSTIDIKYNDKECPNKYTPAISHTTVEVKTFSFVFKCGLQIILNSISSLLTDVIKQQLNGNLGQQLAGSIASSLLSLLTTASETARIDYKDYIATDQRYFKGLNITDNFLIVSSTGQRCYDQNLTSNNSCYGWLTAEVQPPPVFYTNHDVQYQIEKIAFNSGFQLYLKQTRGVQNMVIQNITLRRFFNTGAQLLVNLTVGGEQHQLVYLEPVKFKPVEISPGMFFGSFDIQLTNLISSDGLTQDQTDALSSYFKESYRTYQISYGNALGVSEAKAFTVYLDENWIMIMSDIE